MNEASQIICREVLKNIFWRGEHSLGKAVFAAKCSVITWYPTDDNYYGPAVLYTLFGDPALRVKHGFATGVAESQVPVPLHVAPTATIARGVLYLDAGHVRDMTEIRPGISDRVPNQPALLDAAGRIVMNLHPGANDVRHLAPGVYFVRQTSDVARVILTR